MYAAALPYSDWLDLHNNARAAVGVRALTWSPARESDHGIVSQGPTRVRLCLHALALPGVRSLHYGHGTWGWSLGNSSETPVAKWDVHPAMRVILLAVAKQAAAWALWLAKTGCKLKHGGSGRNGQNLAAAWGSVPRSLGGRFAVGLWLQEGKGYRRSPPRGAAKSSCSGRSWMGCGHYSQVRTAWGRSHTSHLADTLGHR